MQEIAASIETVLFAEDFFASASNAGSRIAPLGASLAQWADEPQPPSPFDLEGGGESFDVPQGTLGLPRATMTVLEAMDAVEHARKRMGHWSRLRGFEVFLEGFDAYQGHPVALWSRYRTTEDGFVPPDVILTIPVRTPRGLMEVRLPSNVHLDSEASAPAAPATATAVKTEIVQLAFAF